MPSGLGPSSGKSEKIYAQDPNCSGVKIVVSPFQVEIPDWEGELLIV